jgi:hypothetical protein
LGSGVVVLLLVVVVVVVVVVVLLLLLGGAHQPVANAYHCPEAASWMMHGSGKLSGRSGVLAEVGVVGAGRRRVTRM